MTAPAPKFFGCKFGVKAVEVPKMKKTPVFAKNEKHHSL